MYPPKTNMTMETQPFESMYQVSPKNCDFPAGHVSFQGEVTIIKKNPSCIHGCANEFSQIPTRWAPTNSK